MIDGLRVMERGGLDHLIAALRDGGYRVLGPTVQDQSIVYDDVEGTSELPVGWTDEQEAGHYRLARSGSDAMFDYTVGPNAWKKFLHPSVLKLWHARREGDEVRVTGPRVPDRPFAFIGVRACDLHAIAIQDRVFLGGPYQDANYGARRRDAFVVAVNCGKASGTCFCVSMNTGPKADAGFDLALTEIGADGQRRFVVEVGTERGAAVLDSLATAAASEADRAEATAVVERTAASMGREMRTDDVHDLLTGNPTHPRWDDVAARCLTCGNCTMVCPTCFCTSVEESSDLTGLESSRTRRWDSCFTMDFSYVHGGSVRSSGRSRYRQWMTHKLATWIDQFGTSGCVGCGRCITWCPVGIDITEEVRAIRDNPAGDGGRHGD